MTIRFLAEAEAELGEAVAYYDGLLPGLGAEFALDVRDSVARIEQPESLATPEPPCEALPFEAISLWSRICAAPIGNRRIGGHAPAPKARLLVQI